MGRRKAEPANLNDVRELLTRTPVWVGPVLAVVVFVILFTAAPLLFAKPENGADVGAIFRPFIRLFAVVAFVAILVTWGVAELHKVRRRRLLDRQNGLESIRRLTWQQFEELIAEAYRRRGYTAQVVGSSSGDGGVDVELQGNGQIVLIQCKQWKVYKVGVKTVRELLGVVVSRRATHGILITSGRFTTEAVRFAQSNPTLELIDGEGLASLIASIQTTPLAVSKTPSIPPPLPIPTGNVISCPQCGSPMVLRTAKKGSHAGTSFYGCSRFPKCYGRQSV